MPKWLLIMLGVSLVNTSFSESERLGTWMEDCHGLPSFEYAGKLPFRAVLDDGRPVKPNEEND
jgi:hypothetical protein